MRVTIVTALFLVLGTYMNGQTVNDVPLSEIDVEFIQIVGTKKLFSPRVNIDIEFGQMNKLFSANDTRIKDEEGNNLDFNSMIDALNFMSGHGYDYLDAYAISMGNNTNVYHFIMRKRAE